jgi:HAMP domain-containing protein
MFTPFGHPSREPQNNPQPESGTGATKPASSDEVSALKDEIEAMRRQLAEIARSKG